MNLLYLDILEDAHKLADELTDSSEFKRLQALKKQIMTECCYLISNFNIAKANYELLADAHNKAKLVETKTKLYNHPLVKEYKALLLLFDNKLRDISQALTKDVKGSN